MNKKYYSVKEAAKLLGVSTNTLYKYLDEGKIVAKRIGMGRFKIPYKALAIYLENPEDPGLINSGNIAQTVASPTFENSMQIGKHGQPDMNVNTPDRSTILMEKSNNETRGIWSDKFFWRLFKGLVLLGLGFIYLFSDNLVFKFSGTYFEESSQILNFLLPWGLIVAGGLTLVDVFYETKISKYDPIIHFISSLVLSYYSFVSLISGEYDRFIFAGAFTFLTVSHLISGSRHEGNFYQSFIKFVSISSLVGGVIILLFPSDILMPGLAAMVATHSGFFGLFWFGLMTVPALYLMSSYGKNSKRIASIFLLVGGVFVLIFATEFAIEGKWDVSYITYLLAIFGLFLAWWRNAGVKIDNGKITYIGISFVWIAVAIIIGLFVVKSSSEDILKRNNQIIVSNFENDVNRLDTKIKENSAILTNYAGQTETKALVTAGDQEKATEWAKVIYNRTDLALRVFIINEKGTTVGAYPRESMALGVNLSSRDYFQRTKSTYTGVISNVFTSIMGNSTIVMTEPVFEDNKLIGVLALGLDLNKLSQFAVEDIGKDNSVDIFDRNGTYAFGSHPSDIGEKIDTLNYLNTSNIGKNSKYFTYKTVSVDPGWNYNLQIARPRVVSESSYLNLLLSIFILINSAFSILAGLSVSSQKGVNEKNVFINPTGLADNSLNYGA